MNKFKRFEGVTDAVMKSVTSVMRQSSKAAYEEKTQDAQKMAARYESVRPKTDVEKSVRPIERMYAFMKPTKAAPKEETIAERVQMIAEMHQQMGTTPKTDKHKKLAAFVHPKNKITHADILRARGVPAARGGSRGATSEEQVAEEEKSEKIWPGTPAWKAKFGTDKERHELKFGKSDAKKLKPYGYRDDPEDSPMSAQTKGRGRPKKVRTEEVEEIEEVNSYTKIGKLVRKFIPGQGQTQAGERAKDQKYSAGLDRAALKYHPDDKKLATTIKSSEKAEKRYKRISRGESPFKPSPNDTGVKEEVEQIDENDLSSIAKNHNMKYTKSTYGATMTHSKHGEISINRYGEWHHYPTGSKSAKAKGDSSNKFSSLNQHLSSLNLGKHTRPNLPEQAAAEGMQQALRKYVPGYAKRELDKKMDAQAYEKGDSTKKTVDKDVNFDRYKKIADKLKNEEIEELKKTTLGSYVKKAAGSLADTNASETEEYLFSQEEIDRLSEIANSFNPNNKSQL